MSAAIPSLLQWVHEVGKPTHNDDLIAATVLTWQGRKLAWQKLLNKAHVALRIIVNQLLAKDWATQRWDHCGLIRRRKLILADVSNIQVTVPKT